MRKGIITAALSMALAVFLWAQPKKPVVVQKKKTVTTIKKPGTPVKSAPASSKTATPVKTASAVSISSARGEAVYAQICIACHQKDGGGVPRLNPPLIKTDYVLGDKTRLINIVLKGMNQPLEIEGESFSNPMPALSHLTDQQVADVLTYVRNNFGNKASAITETEVKAVRAKNL